MRYMTAILMLLLAGCASTAPPPTKVISADFNGDGVTDRVELHHSGTKTEIGYPCVMNVSLTVDGTQQHALRREYSSRFPGMMDVRAHDLNADGAADLVVATYSGGVTHTYMTVTVMRYDPKKKSFVTVQTKKDIEDKNLDDINLSRL